MSTTANDLDAMIDEALNAEERELLQSIGDEPNYFNQAMGIFSGRLGWVHMVIMLAQTVMFVAGVYLAWQFFHAADQLQALQYGLPAAVFILMSGIIKMAMWPSIQTNRVLRELKRLELQIARGRNDQ